MEMTNANALAYEKAVHSRCTLAIAAEMGTAKDYYEACHHAPETKCTILFDACTENWLSALPTRKDKAQNSFGHLASWLFASSQQSYPQGTNCDQTKARSFAIILITDDIAPFIRLRAESTHQGPALQPYISTCWAART
jgi:hypothetical protein